jgi:hypothetical protein
MKLHYILSLLMLTLIISGCKAPQNTSKSSKKDNSISRSEAFSMTASDLAGIMPAFCKELGITIDEATETLHRYEAICKTLTGLDVKFEAVTFVEGKTLVVMTVQGKDRVAQAVYGETWYRLKRAIQEKSPSR